MAIRRIEIHLPAGDAFDKAIRIVKAADPLDYLVIELEQRDRRLIQVFMRDGPAQPMLDNLQSALESRSGWRITVAPLDVTLPKLPEPKGDKKDVIQQNSREQLYV